MFQRQGPRRAKYHHDGEQGNTQRIKAKCHEPRATVLEASTKSQETMFSRYPRPTREIENYATQQQGRVLLSSACSRLRTLYFMKPPALNSTLCLLLPILRVRGNHELRSTKVYLKMSVFQHVFSHAVETNNPPKNFKNLFPDSHLSFLMLPRSPRVSPSCINGSLGGAKVEATGFPNETV